MSKIQSHLIRYVVSLCVLSGIVWLGWRNWPVLYASFSVIADISVAHFSIGIGLVLLTFVLAALSYRMLAFRQLRLSELLTVELASAFINRLVPSGIGGLSIHGLYLHKRKHTVAEATAVVSVNNLTGIIVHVTLLCLVLILVGGGALFSGAFTTKQLVLPAILLTTALFLLYIPRARAKVVGFLHNLGKSLRLYAKEPRRVLFAASALVALTFTNVLILYVMTRAVGISLELPQLFIIFSAGILVGAAVPTPGGLAGVEAGLIAGFLAYGVGSELAIATTLAFRLITYWFPLVPGGIVLLFSRKKLFG